VRRRSARSGFRRPKSQISDESKLSERSEAIDCAVVEQAWLDELAEFIRIPSVSADPAHRDDVARAAEWVADYLRAAGGNAELLPTDKQPLMVGELRASNGAADAPTVLVYGHFDVQPPAPLELWESDPFELDIRGEWAYGRGITDDKGNLWLLLRGASELARAGSLPVNLRFACDGEEEIGGMSIVKWLADDDQGADACLIFDGGFAERGVPAFGIATRGLIAFDIEVRTGDRDLHSGLYGNAALNAIHALMQTLDGILPRDGRLPEPLREGAETPTDEERAAWKELRDGQTILDEAGARPYDDGGAEEYYLRTTAEPSVDVNGILGGKPGLRNTTLPVHAEANFTIRLAPGQRVEPIARAAEKLLRDAAPAHADVMIKQDDSADPALFSPDLPVIKLAQDAFEEVVGVRPLLLRSGGTLPIMPALAEKGMPTVLAGFGLEESNIHSPNERFLVEYFPLGVETAKRLYVKLAELRR
jgi:acetylornithine deacetylase/succinyl-diaminopimelate desuccinylase-like protein